MSNQLALVSVSDLATMAQAVAKSGLFGMKTPEQAMALMLVSQAEGRHPASAAMDYHIFQGKPTLKAEVMLSRFLSVGGKVKWLSLSESEAEAEFSHPTGGTVKIKWSIEMAKKAGLTGKDIWKNYPRAMLRSRTVSEGVRTVCPSVTGGFYTPEEIENLDPEVAAKDMGNVELVSVSEVKVDAKPAYPDESFEKHLPSWKVMIMEGRKTANGIINTVSTKNQMTNEQKKTLIEFEFNTKEAQINPDHIPDQEQPF